MVYVRCSTHLVAPGNFQRMPLPGNHLNCTTSTGVSFPAPPGFSVSNIAANGATNGLSGAGAAVGQGGYYDFQRFQVGSVTQFFKGYTPVANVAVGAHVQGTGAPQWVASLISNTYAFFNSNNGATAQQAQFRNLGFSLATHVIRKSVGAASKRFRETPRPRVHRCECGRDRLLPSACISRLEDTAGARGGSCLRGALRVGLSPAGLRCVPSGRPRMGRLALTSQGAEEGPMVVHRRWTMADRHSR
jgi:hypothetical protein